MGDNKSDVEQGKSHGKIGGEAGTVEDQASGRTNPHLDNRPRLDAEQAALAARIIRGTDGDNVSQEARDDLAAHLDTIANYNGD